LQIRELHKLSAVFATPDDSYKAIITALLPSEDQLDAVLEEEH
jgi:hypothetical protein